MISHAFYIQVSPEEKSLLELRLCANRNEFLTEMAEVGAGVDEGAQGISYQFRCSTTRKKKNLVLLNLETVDIETVAHEVRHSMFWAFSDDHGAFSLNLMDRDAEEHFNSLIDDMTLHVVKFIQQRLAGDLEYIQGLTQDPDYETEIPEHIKRLVDG